MDEQKWRKETWDMLISSVCEDSVQYQIDDVKDEEKIHNKHDKGYKYLFSVKKNFIQFVKTFMKVQINVELTEDNITLMDKEFITKEFGKQESDIIYEVKSENKVLYFVLLELQHKVDRKMAYRILNYMIEIWRKWEKNKVPGETFILPKIIPCVLYNGEDKWTAPVTLKELYDDIGENEDYLLNFKYVLIDIFRYKPEDLYNIGNVISSAFYLDIASKDKLWERLNSLSESLRHLDSESWKIFMTWVSKIFVIDEKNQIKLEEKLFKWEDDDMGTIERVRQEIFNDGVVEGKALGISEGRAEGKIIGIREGFNNGMVAERVASIKRLLHYKLKISLSSRRMELIDKAPIEKLSEIEMKIFEITSWKEVEEILKR